MIDTLFSSLSGVASQLLPIIGAVALVFLCIVLYRLMKLLVEVTKTVEKLDPTLQKVDLSMEKIQVPLDTVVKYSKSLDEVQEKTKDSMSKAGSFMGEKAELAKNFMNDSVQKVAEIIKKAKKEDYKTDPFYRPTTPTETSVKEVVEEVKEDLQETVKEGKDHE